MEHEFFLNGKKTEMTTNALPIDQDGRKGRTRKLHKSKGENVKKRLFNPMKSIIAKKRWRALLAA